MMLIAMVIDDLILFNMVMMMMMILVLMMMIETCMTAEDSDDSIFKVECEKKTHYKNLASRFFIAG